MSTDLNRLCLGCMNLLPQQGAICPKCNWPNNAVGNMEHLPPGTRLKVENREYLLGKSLGQGGFGIVYVAWDVAHDRKVAIKEFFPSVLAQRTHSYSVIVKNNSDPKVYKKFLGNFQKEYSNMVTVKNDPNTVEVLDYVDANGTAYIVMEFIDGETFNLTNPEDNDDFPLEKLLEYFLSERNISFILKINSENGIVELIDKNGCCLFLKIEKFFLKLKENYEVNKCLCAYNSNEHTDENKYCINCNIFICSLCSIQHLYNNHTSIPKNYLGSICLIHCKETSFYCKDCEKSVCKECLDKFHKSHMKSEINRKFVKKAKKEINWKNKQLSKLIEFYRMIRLASEDEPGNHYYIKNIINVGRLIELEERRNKYDKDLAIYRIKQLMNRSGSNLVYNY